MPQVQIPDDVVIVSSYTDDWVELVRPQGDASKAATPRKRAGRQVVVTDSKGVATTFDGDLVAMWWSDGFIWQITDALGVLLGEFLNPRSLIVQAKAGK